MSDGNDVAEKLSRALHRIPRVNLLGRLAHIPACPHHPYQEDDEDA